MNWRYSSIEDKSKISHHTGDESLKIQGLNEI